RHFLEKGKSYSFVWQNSVRQAVVLEEPRDGWVKVREDNSEQWINMSKVHRVTVALEGKGVKGGFPPHPAFGASIFGMLGSPTGPGPLLAASTFFTGRTGIPGAPGEKE